MYLQAEIAWGEVFCAFPVFIPGVLFILLSIPMLFNKIPPNAWYGFRTEKTLSNKEIWYKANCYMARDFLVFGVLHTVFVIIFFILEKSQIVEFNLPGPWTLLIFPFPMVLGLVIVIYRSFKYLKKL
ncbi:MAG: SdpI family protein [Planctomycetes bacterium]|nr:SdpI family protein [Planctomycetota bacterium]